MATVTVMGAGSVAFTQKIASSLWQRPATSEITIHLMDIKADHLGDAERMVRPVVKAARSCSSVKAETELPLILWRSVINMVPRGRYEAVQPDFHIPAHYGIRHTVGDTVGVAGIMRAVRTALHVVRLARPRQQVAPQARLCNDTNPMSMLVMDIARSSSVQHDIRPDARDG